MTTNSNEFRMISDAAVQGAFDWLLDNSGLGGAARANLTRKEFEAKYVFAQMLQRADGTVEVKKAWATTRPEYREAQRELAIAEETWENFKDQRNRAEIIIEAWRTEQASRRIIDRIT